MKRIKALLILILSALLMASCVVTDIPDESVGTDEEALDVLSKDDEEKNDDEIKPDGSADNSQVDKTVGTKENKETLAVEKQDESKSNTPETADEISADRWKIKPNYVYDFIETCGNTEYSIYKQGEAYGIMDIDGYYIGEETYSELVWCPTHGFSSKDVSGEPVVLREDLSISPDCGYRKSAGNDVIYVFDSSRDRVYATGYSDGAFKIADITDTDFYTQNERYTVVLYDCDADIMMYDGIGMKNLAEVFAAENKEMHYGVIDTDMDYVIACIYDEVRDGNDCYIVKQNGKYGYRAISGKEYYPCVFDEANTASGGRAWVKYKGKWGTIKF